MQKNEEIKETNEHPLCFSFFATWGYAAIFSLVLLYPLTAIHHTRLSYLTPFSPPSSEQIQNVEVVAMHECKEDRVLESIKKIEGYEKFKLKNSKVLSDELWTIKRCDKKMSYWVRYYEQDQNGYSLSIIPTQVKNILGFLKYYYF